jgi:hypothetical protein
MKLLKELLLIEAEIKSSKIEWKPPGSTRTYVYDIVRTHIADDDDEETEGDYLIGHREGDRGKGYDEYAVFLRRSPGSTHVSYVVSLAASTMNGANSEFDRFIHHKKKSREDDEQQD